MSHSQFRRRGGFKGAGEAEARQWLDQLTAALPGRCLGCGVVKSKQSFYNKPRCLIVQTVQVKKNEGKPNG